MRTPIVAPLAVTGRHGEQSWRRHYLYPWESPIPRQERICTKCSKRILGDEFHFLFECNGIEKLRISSIPKYYRTRCSTLKMSQLLNTNDRKLLIKVAKFVYFGMKEYTSLPDVVSEEIDNVDLNCLYD